MYKKRIVRKMLLTVGSGTEIALKTYALIRPAVPRNDLNHLLTMQIKNLSLFFKSNDVLQTRFLLATFKDFLHKGWFISLWSTPYCFICANFSMSRIWI